MRIFDEKEGNFGWKWVIFDRNGDFWSKGWFLVGNSVGSWTSAFEEWWLVRLKLRFKNPNGFHQFSFWHSAVSHFELQYGTFSNQYIYLLINQFSILIGQLTMNGFDWFEPLFNRVLPVN